jgi:hypothetical protein
MEGLEILERSREEGAFIRSGDLLRRYLHNRHTRFLNGELPISKMRFPCTVKLQVLNCVTGNERTPQV